jgi:hypothetical protein
MTFCQRIEARRGAEIRVRRRAVAERPLMTPEHHEVAALLAAFGPWTSAQLADALHVASVRAGILAWALCRRGWAIRTGTGAWALTDAGLDMLELWNIEAPL